ncbi:hypothetical protein BKA80DRAFT_255145 [Phyllosticta citrichinensis]
MPTQVSPTPYLEADVAVQCVLTSTSICFCFKAAKRTQHPLVAQRDRCCFLSSFQSLTSPSEQEDFASPCPNLRTLTSCSRYCRLPSVQLFIYFAELIRPTHFVYFDFQTSQSLTSHSRTSGFASAYLKILSYSHQDFSPVSSSSFEGFSASFARPLPQVYLFNTAFSSASSRQQLTFRRIRDSQLCNPEKQPRNGCREAHSSYHRILLVSGLREQSKLILRHRRYGRRFALAKHNTDSTVFNKLLPTLARLLHTSAQRRNLTKGVAEIDSIALKSCFRQMNSPPSKLSCPSSNRALYHQLPQPANDDYISWD